MEFTHETFDDKLGTAALEQTGTAALEKRTDPLANFTVRGCTESVTAADVVGSSRAFFQAESCARECKATRTCLVFVPKPVEVISNAADRLGESTKQTQTRRKKCKPTLF